MAALMLGAPLPLPCAPPLPSRALPLPRALPPALSSINEPREGESSMDFDLDLKSPGVRWLWDDDEDDMPDDYNPELTQSFVDYNFVADYGFDPLRLSRFDLNLGSGLDKTRPLQIVIRDYREAELRHGRLAMLAALAWPVQELLSPTLSRAIRAPILTVETGGRTPSVLNGGLEQSTIPLTIAAFFLLIAAVDVYSLRLKEQRGDDWLPGDFGFDPLNILGGATLDERRNMQALEINHGRMAMVAVLIMVVEEAASGRPVVQLTPWLFEPAILVPEVQQALDYEFAASAFRPK